MTAVQPFPGWDWKGLLTVGFAVLSLRLFTFVPSGDTKDWTFWLPSSVEEGQAMAQPAPGWCGPSLRKHRIERFLS